MSQPHVAFIVESAYGHLVPTVGIARELLRREYRVSYAIKQQFKDRILRCGAEPVVYTPMENKRRLFQSAGGPQHIGDLTTGSYWQELRKEETQDTHDQLERHYRTHRPDLIIYDVMNPAGRELANTLRTMAAEHSPMIVYPENSVWPYDDSLVLMAIPRLLQRNADDLDGRFRFVGFVRNGREAFFTPWTRTSPTRRTILVYATTGLLSQVDFFKMAISAFRDTSWQVVMSIGDDTTASQLSPLPSNCEINQHSSNLEILQTADLVIGQAGTGATLEALYYGVPQLLIPPSLAVFEDCAARIAELGLGVRLHQAEITSEELKRHGLSLMRDEAVRKRLNEVARTMQSEHGDVLAADLIGQYLDDRRPMHTLGPGN